MVSTSYYEALGVPETARAEEIKRAYRELARKYHPDRNPGDTAAEERFKAIGRAFEILSDPEKRRMYDEFGEDAERMGFDPERAQAYRAQSEGVRGQGGKGGFDPLEDLMRGFGAGGPFGARSPFGGGRPFDGRGGVDPQTRPQDGSDLTADLKISFEEAVRGGERALRITKPRRCDDCGGSGTRGSVRPCGECGGSGERLYQQGALQFSRPCPACGGTGQVGEPCASCDGQGVRSRATTLNIKIPAGVTDGQVIRLRSQGSPGLRGGRDGDLRITVTVSPHPWFTREGRNLRLDVPLTVPEALNGTEVDIPTLEGTVKLKVPAGAQNGAKLRLRRKGVGPKGDRGDLYAVLKIRMPDSKRDPEAARQAAELLERLYDEPVRSSWNR